MNEILNQNSKGVESPPDMTSFQNINKLSLVIEDLDDNSDCSSIPSRSVSSFSECQGLSFTDLQYPESQDDTDSIIDEIDCVYNNLNYWKRALPDVSNEIDKIVRKNSTEDIAKDLNWNNSVKNYNNPVTDSDIYVDSDSSFKDSTVLLEELRVGSDTELDSENYFVATPCQPYLTDGTHDSSYDSCDTFATPPDLSISNENENDLQLELVESAEGNQSDCDLSDVSDTFREYLKSRFQKPTSDILLEEAPHDNGWDPVERAEWINSRYPTGVPVLFIEAVGESCTDDFGSVSSKDDDDDPPGLIENLINKEKDSQVNSHTKGLEEYSRYE